MKAFKPESLEDQIPRLAAGRPPVLHWEQRREPMAPVLGLVVTVLQLLPPILHQQIAITDPNQDQNET